MIKHDPEKYLFESENNYKKGIDFQREKFKESKFDNNYDAMCDSLENIKSEIKTKMLQKNNREALIKIENILEWYRTLEKTHTKNTPEGKRVVFPADIHYIANKNLTLAYELLIEQLEILDLL